MTMTKKIRRIGFIINLGTHLMIESIVAITKNKNSDRDNANLNKVKKGSQI